MVAQVGVDGLNCGAPLFYCTHMTPLANRRAKRFRCGTIDRLRFAQTARSTHTLACPTPQNRTPPMRLRGTVTRETAQARRQECYPKGRKRVLLTGIARGSRLGLPHYLKTILTAFTLPPTTPHAQVSTSTSTGFDSTDDQRIRSTLSAQALANVL